MVSLKNDDP